MFERPDGLYGAFEDLPVISRKGHFRRMELLARLDIGNVTQMRIVDFGMGSWGFAATYPACMTARLPSASTFPRRPSP